MNYREYSTGSGVQQVVVSVTLHRVMPFSADPERQRAQIEVVQKHLEQDLKHNWQVTWSKPVLAGHGPPSGLEPGRHRKEWPA